MSTDETKAAIASALATPGLLDGRWLTPAAADRLADAVMAVVSPLLAERDALREQMQGARRSLIDAMALGPGEGALPVLVDRLVAGRDVARRHGRVAQDEADRLAAEYARAQGETTLLLWLHAEAVWLAGEQSDWSDHWCAMQEDTSTVMRGLARRSAGFRSLYFTETREHTATANARDEERESRVRWAEEAAEMTGQRDALRRERDYLAADLAETAAVRSNFARQRDTARARVDALEAQLAQAVVLPEWTHARDQVARVVAANARRTTAAEDTESPAFRHITCAEDLLRLLESWRVATQPAEPPRGVLKETGQSFNSAAENASDLQHGLAPVPAVDRQALVRLLAERAFNRYDQEFDATYLSWQDFAPAASGDLDALLSSYHVTAKQGDDRDA